MQNIRQMFFFLVPLLQVTPCYKFSSCKSKEPTRPFQTWGHLIFSKGLRPLSCSKEDPLPPTSVFPNTKSEQEEAAINAISQWEVYFHYMALNLNELQYNNLFQICKVTIVHAGETWVLLVSQLKNTPLKPQLP